MTTLDYSCGCSVTHSNKESILTSKDGVKYKVVGSKLEKNFIKWLTNTLFIDIINHINKHV